MNKEHPIAPPPKLVEQWWRDAQQTDYSDGLPCWLNYVATEAARWGADQELDACCAYLAKAGLTGDACGLQLTRRPKPPSLKEQALIELGDVYNRNKIDDVTYDTIRLALEQLND